MSNKLDIDEYTDPPIFERPSRSTWLAVFVVLALIAGAIALVHGAEPAKPELWAYVSRSCKPCARFKQDNKDGKLSDFTVYVIETDCGTVPRFVFWNKSHTHAAPTLEGYGDANGLRQRYREMMKR